MTSRARPFTLSRGTALWRILALTAVFVVIAVGTPATQAQTFSVIHSFTGSDGAQPWGNLVLDQQGNVYGTASAGGFTGNNCTSSGCGTVFKLTRRGSSWIFAPLYSFHGNSDGAMPFAGVTIGPNGSLYGTTYLGGSFGFGTAYNLRPPAHFSSHVLGGWSEAVIYNFGLGTDARYPGLGSVIFDPAGNMYGTTTEGGTFCSDGGTCGTVFTLVPSGGGWTESILFEFSGGSGGALPLSGVVRDSAGNLYGTTDFGVVNPVAYQLTRSGQGWTETTLHMFGNSSDTRAGVILDGAGGLYGADVDGDVYQLSPSGGMWIYNVLYSFSGSSGVWGPLVRDANGNLYGATCGDGTHGQGSVFKLTPSGRGWTESDLYDFTAGSDGSCPIGGVALDAAGNIYGTTAFGGTGCGGAGCGVVWEIAP